MKLFIYLDYYCCHFYSLIKVVSIILRKTLSGSVHTQFRGYKDDKTRYSRERFRVFRESVEWMIQGFNDSLNAEKRHSCVATYWRIDVTYGYWTNQNLVFLLYLLLPGSLFLLLLQLFQGVLNMLTLQRHFCSSGRSDFKWTTKKLYGKQTRASFFQHVLRK